MVNPPHELQSNAGNDSSTRSRIADHLSEKCSLKEKASFWQDFSVNHDADALAIAWLSIAKYDTTATNSELVDILIEFLKLPSNILSNSSVASDILAHLNLFPSINPLINSLRVSLLHQLWCTNQHISPFLSHLASLLYNIIVKLFPRAESARKECHHKEATDTSTVDTHVQRSRPEDECALLKALKLTDNVWRAAASQIPLPITERLLDCAIKCAYETTGTALLYGLTQIIIDCMVSVSLEPGLLKSSLLILCRIGGHEKYQLSKDVENAVLRLLRSERQRLVVADVLVEGILLLPQQSGKVMALVLNILSAHLHSSNTPSEDYARLAKLVTKIAQHFSITLQPSDLLASSLMNLASACGLYNDFVTFQGLFQAIDATLKISSTPEDSSNNINYQGVQIIVHLFNELYTRDGAKTMLLFDLLLRTAANMRRGAAKLSAIQFLLRLRCDSDGRLVVIGHPESYGLGTQFRGPKVPHSDSRLSSPTTHISPVAPHRSIRREFSRTSESLPSHRPRSTTRTDNTADRWGDAEEITWHDEQGTPLESINKLRAASDVVRVKNGSKDVILEGQHYLDTGRLLGILNMEIKEGLDWQVYTYIICHITSQLNNCTFYHAQALEISNLHELLNLHLSGDGLPHPPRGSPARRGEVALCLYYALSGLLAYQDCIGVRQWNRTVSTFRAGVEKWDGVGKFCIQALTLCAYEIPNIVENHLHVIIEMMQKRITQSDMAMDVLQFLADLARLPDAYNGEDVALHQKIFGICIRYLQHARDQRREAARQSTRLSEDGVSRQSKISAHEPDGKLLREYVFTLAYHVMIFWFLAIDVQERPRHVAWITRELTWKSENGCEEMEHQSMVFLDMMHRTTHSNLGETKPNSDFLDKSRIIYSSSWLLGLSVVTAQMIVNPESGKPESGQLVKRQASGTTYANYTHNTEDSPAHQIPSSSKPNRAFKQNDLLKSYPNHMFLQLSSTASPFPTPLQPILLPDGDDMVDRAIRLFDATSTVDGHKAAVIYVREGHMSEGEVLSNTSVSRTFTRFLDNLAYKVPLKHASFNTQGLDREYGTDGEFTFAWRDRVTEIVFHVPSMMPTDMKHDKAQSRKKSHIGNDHVKIIFNESGSTFDTATFSTDFNSINIMITPEAAVSDEPNTANDGVQLESMDLGNVNRYYLVHTVVSPRYPAFSATASPKVISESALPAYIRQLALTSSVLCQFWAPDSGEYNSTWGFRLQQILKLRARFANANASGNVDYPLGDDARPSEYVEGSAWIGKMLYGGLTEQDHLASSLDFTRWTQSR